MHPALAPLHSVLTLNTRLLANCLVDMDDAMAARRVAGANSPAFLAMHLTDTRWYLVRLAGGQGTSPFADRLDGITSIEQLTDYPPLAAIRDAWATTLPAITARCEALDKATLRRPLDTPFPGTDGSLLGGLAFLVHHDCYHLGQAAVLRRQIGLPAMRYD